MPFLSYVRPKNDVSNRKQRMRKKTYIGPKSMLIMETETTAVVR
jgi:hypothetical protein